MSCYQRKRSFGKFLPGLRGNGCRLRGFLSGFFGKETHVESGGMLKVWIYE